MIPGAATTTLLQKGMKQTVGSPGTWSGLALRVSQCVFAAASVCAMVTVFGFSPIVNYFRYMNTMMLLQTIWSLGLACLDIYAMMNRKDLHKHALVNILVVADWIMATLTYAAACGAAGVATLFLDDVELCRRLLKEACSQNTVPIVLAFIAGLFWVISGISMSSLRASFP